MYESVPYDTYGEYEVFPDGKSGLLPAEGSVMRGWLPYEVENSIEGYDFAKANLTNDLVYTEANLAKGKALYDIYCGICHGSKGDGNGKLVEREKILGVPAYNDVGRAITEGSIYHVMYYGINSMGSYASQMSEEELWLVDHYVMSLKDKLDKKEARAFDVVEQVMEVEALDAHAMLEDHGQELHEEEDHGSEH
jgi:mono/diheme cytochrome c family protein